MSNNPASNHVPSSQGNEYVINKLCCPLSHQPVHIENEAFVSIDGVYRYAISSSGIPLFAESFLK
jgi:hypothetical protein